MAKPRKMVLTLLMLLAISSGIYLYLGVFGAQLKGTTSQAYEISLELVQTLAERGVLLPEGTNSRELAFEVYDPLRIALNQRVRSCYTYGSVMIFIGFAGLAVVWWPVKRTAASE